MAIWWFVFHPGRRDDPPQDVNALSTVALLKQLASDATQSLGQKDALVRAPLFGVQAIGVLIDPEKDIGLSRRCHASEDPATLQPAGFPPQSYSVSRDAAAKLTAGFLGSATAGVDLGNSRAIDLNFEDVTAHLIYPDEAADMLKSPVCRDAVGDRKLWVVLGNIAARRTFTIRSAFVDKGSLARGNSRFEVDAGSDGRTVTVRDKAPLPLFEIVAELPAGASTELVRPAATTAQLTGAKVENGRLLLTSVAPAQKAQGLIYFQRDEADASGNAERLIAALGAGGLRAERIVETLPSAKMPLKPSVRYYNDEDRPLAEKVAAYLQPLYGAATVTQLKYKAPIGQMEVWLPRVGSAGRTAKD